MSVYEPWLTIGEFVRMLQEYPKDMLIDFSSLDFYRLKWDSGPAVRVEFTQPIYWDSAGNVVVKDSMIPQH